MGFQLLQGDAIEQLRTLADQSIHCCVTSPPYWGLRDYSTCGCATKRAVGSESLRAMGGTKDGEGSGSRAMDSRGMKAADPDCPVCRGTGKIPEMAPRVWGGDEGCQHEWAEHVQPAANGIVASEMQGETLSGNSATRRPKRSAFCAKCGAWKGSLGLEPTPDLYVTHLVEVFREARRVLRDDGTLWVNIGDSYASGKGTCYNPGGGDDSLGQEKKAAGVHPLDRGNKSTLAENGLKPKDLVGIPWMLAFALRADGWHLRSDIIWNKANCLPESVQDRPTKNHEYIFLFSKREKYFYDRLAIAEPCVSGPSDVRKMLEQKERLNGHKSLIEDEMIAGGASSNIGHKRGVGGVLAGSTLEGTPVGRHFTQQALPEWERRDPPCPPYEGGMELPDNYKDSLPGRSDGPGQDRRSANPRSAMVREEREDRSGGMENALRVCPQPGHGYDRGQLLRNKRTVWSITTRAFTSKDLGDFDCDHYASFPVELPETCLRAGTSEWGVCPKCGSPYIRQVQKVGASLSVAERIGRVGQNGGPPQQSGWFWDGPVDEPTGGWAPSCNCDFGEPVAAVVLDCFAGVCSTGLAALRNGRDFIGIDLHPIYLEIGRARLTSDALANQTRMVFD